MHMADVSDELKRTYRLSDGSGQGREVQLKLESVRTPPRWDLAQRCSDKCELDVLWKPATPAMTLSELACRKTERCADHAAGRLIGQPPRSRAKCRRWMRRAKRKMRLHRSGGGRGYVGQGAYLAAPGRGGNAELKVRHQKDGFRARLATSIAAIPNLLIGGLVSDATGMTLLPLYSVLAQSRVRLPEDGQVTLHLELRARGRCGAYRAG